MSAWDEVKRERALEAGWFDIHRSDVELPDGTVGRGWHWVDFRQPAVGVVPVREDGAILLIQQFRFVTRTRGWEIPAGRVDEGEELEIAAGRELWEETGYRAAELDSLGHYFPSNGSSNQEFVLYVARGLEQVGQVPDTNEVEAIQWFTGDELKRMVRRNEILDGMTVAALLWYFLVGESEENRA